MNFGLFYEIPAARPWTAESEHDAYRHTLEQAILGDQVGFHSSCRSPTTIRSARPSRSRFSTEKVMRSIRPLAEHVLPAFR